MQQKARIMAADNADDSTLRELSGGPIPNNRPNNRPNHHQTKPRRPKAKQDWRLPIILTVVLTSVLAAITLIVFQDNVTRFVLKPRTPYQTMPPPPAPNYADEEAWFLRPQIAAQDAPQSAQTTPKAAIFYVHGATYYSAKAWNAPHTDDNAQQTLKTIAAPNELGPFKSLGLVYAPYYRQATLFSYFTTKYDGVAARQTAFEDIDAAFVEFLKQANDRAQPIILVGYGQGGLYVLGLLQRHFQTDQQLRDRLVAAYVLDHAAPAHFFDDIAPHTPPCRDRGQTGCVIGYAAREAAFEADITRLRERSLTWSAQGRLTPKAKSAPLSSNKQAASLCINPLTWRQDETYAQAEKHIGAASATGLGLAQTPPAIAHALGVQCQNGVLVVDRPPQPYLRRRHWFGTHWKAQHFNLFYHDLRQDAARRLRLARPSVLEAARSLAPIGAELELTVSPINKVPD